MEFTPVMGGAEILAPHPEVELMSDALELYAASCRNMADTFIRAGANGPGQTMAARAKYAERLGFQIEIQSKQTPA